MTAPVHHHRERVREEWIDYNGHLSEAYYVLVLGHATDRLMEAVGLDDDYRQRTGCSLYTAEAHVRYLREVGRDAELQVTTRVLAVDAKKVHLAHEMYVDDVLAATEELLALHVDSAAGRSAPFPNAVREVLDRRVEPEPDYASRAIAIAPARPAG